MKATGVVSERDPHFLDPDVFDNISDSELNKPLDSLMFSIDHLQRAHLIAIYIEQLTPTEKGITHLDGGTIKGYILMRFSESVGLLNEAVANFPLCMGNGPGKRIMSMI